MGLENVMTPHVSVVIDTYNQERFIEEAIASALEQDFPAEEREILVVDDGSTDRTAEIARKFEPQVRVIGKRNGGQASAINFGVERARGSVVAFLDGDDVWLPNKLSRTVEAFEREPAPVMAYHRYCFWDSRNGATWEPEYFAAVSGDILADPRKRLTYWASPTSSLAFRRDTLARLVPVPEQCSFMHDIYLVGAVVCLGPVAGIDECLTRNRVHGQNLCFADRGSLDPGLLRRRIHTWDEALACAGEWIQSNAPPASRARAAILLKRWRLVQEADALRLAPSRLRAFAHQARHNRLYRDVMTASDSAYSWFYALGLLLLGQEHSHYVEGVRTRLRRGGQHFGRWFRPAARMRRSP